MIREYRPTTPGQRGMTTQDFSEITTNKPVKSLLIAKKQKSGRNAHGRITVRHRGGGAKKFIRQVNFRPDENFSGVIEHIEYDPNRSARIARILDDQNKYHYMIAAKGMKIGDNIRAGENAQVETGSILTLEQIPIGSTIYSVELIPGKGAKVARSAGTGAQLMAREGEYAQVKLPSGEVRRVNVKCRAQIGTVGNEQHQNVKIGKAGRKRRMGIRPTVRGVVMNPVDHPHGGGEARGKGGDVPRTPWGQKTLGYKTRRRKLTQNFIIRSRHEGKR